MTTAITARYEFSYTTTATGVPTSFAIGNIADDVASGIKAGLEGVTTISAVNAVEVAESRTPVA